MQTPEYHCWLDPIIEQQAQHYGLSIEKFTKLMSDAAEEQERIEESGEDS